MPKTKIFSMNFMNTNDNWPFVGESKVSGMPLLTYLEWASGTVSFPKRLLLPPIQRGFVWKPVQIAQLWDSLLRGMPIGSLMVSKLPKGQKATGIGVKDREQVQSVTTPAIGLLDGQQRTLAMLLGWKNGPKSDHCVWVDLSESGKDGSPFELRISTRTQPFGYQRHSHTKLSRYERREARRIFDKPFNEVDPLGVNKLRDFELFEHEEAPRPYPWKGEKSAALCFLFKELWGAFRVGANQGLEQYVAAQFNKKSTASLSPEESDLLQANLHKLYSAFQRLALIEVPLILIPDHISQPPVEDVPEQKDAPAPLTLLFERIGRNGASLSADDLLFSMIKQQWPEAHDLVAELHRGKVGNLMSATDYVMTAYRLAMAEAELNDTPRPAPNDFHRHLGDLIQEQKIDKKEGPLRTYLRGGDLSAAFNSLYDTLKYRGDGDVGLPDLMLPHLSRGLVQVLLRWFMLNPDKEIQRANRPGIIAFTLFWYLCIWHEDKASKLAFEKMQKGAFPAHDIYCAMVDTPTGETGLALPLISPGTLEDILFLEPSHLLRNAEEQFKAATLQQCDLYKRFCWWRKPVLLWLQREYVQTTYQSDECFAGLTDEDAVPYDYDHLCPQNHWGTDWRNIEKYSKDFFDKEAWKKLYKPFREGRSDVGNCIGNLHVLDSSLNRSFGDDPLASKFKSGKWKSKDSLLCPGTVSMDWWLTASPELADNNDKWHWDEARLQAFQEAVQRRALGLYIQYFEGCAVLLAK